MRYLPAHVAFLCGAMMFSPSAEAQARTKQQTTIKRVNKSKVGKRTWRARLASMKRAFKARVGRFGRPRLRAKSSARLKPVRAVRPSRSVCSNGTCSAKPRVRTGRSRGLHVVARVSPITRRRYISRSRQLLSRLKGRERVAAFKMVASGRVRRNPAARHVVLAYLKLRTAKGGSRLPISMGQVKQLVTSKGWSGQRMANFALVLKQAAVIAKREGIGAKKAFNKALKINGIYKSYHRSRCGA